jgi:hypothetical protein
MGLRTGTQLAPCEMLSAVGAGGMGWFTAPTAHARYFLAPVGGSAIGRGLTTRLTELVRLREWRLLTGVR